MNTLIIPILSGTHVPKNPGDDITTVTKYQPFTTTLQLMSDPNEQAQLATAMLEKLNASNSPFLDLVTAQFGGWLMAYIYLIDAVNRCIPSTQSIQCFVDETYM